MRMILRRHDEAVRFHPGDERDDSTHRHYAARGHSRGRKGEDFAGPEIFSANRLEERGQHADKNC